jgi:hypothetical protein
MCPVPFRKWLAAALLAPLAASAIARAEDAVVIPRAAWGTEGNSDNQFPFNGDPMRYQQVIAASEFAGTARRITHIVLRPDATAGTACNEALPRIRIDLSTSTRSPANLKRTFAENVGEDVQTVYDGPLTVASAFSGPEGGPKAFDIVIPLQRPFDYDPARGNLLMDVRNFTGGKTTQLDAHDAPDTTSRVWSDKVDAEVANDHDPYPSVGLVIYFICE